MLNSYCRPLCTVQLPYRNRQHYMHAFDLANPIMLPGFEDYARPVRDLCEAAGARVGTAFMTVDEKVVRAGQSQRRPRPHVDGVFVPDLHLWSNGPSPGWNHHCNDIGRGPARRMSVIVVASVAGCRAWEGQFDGQPAMDGDLSHIHSQLGEGQVLPANKGFVLSPDCVHESMLLSNTVERSFLRIALPTEFRL